MCRFWAQFAARQVLSQFFAASNWKQFQSALVAAETFQYILLLSGNNAFVLLCFPCTLLLILL